MAELKEFAVLHARGQGMAARDVRRILAKVGNDEPGHPDSWTAVWRRAGDAERDRHRPLRACRAYAMARFPYAGDPFRAAAQDDCVRAFDAWRRAGTGIERLELDLPGGGLAAWASGLDTGRPLLVVLGGIVSVKEQWAPLLARLSAFGLAGVVTELPGVGEHRRRYLPASGRMLSDLLDRLAGRADVADTSVLAPSFGGHLALRTAAHDPRVRRVLTVGPPVAGFFTDRAWRARLPELTTRTFTHLAGTDPFAAPGWALTPAELAAVRVPVAAVLSGRDEIIPAADAVLLRRNLPDARFRVFDDVHGSPGHVTEMRLWLLHTMQRMRGAGGPATEALGLALAARRLVRPRRFAAAPPDDRPDGPPRAEPLPALAAASRGR
ncbi:alpha/beta hydrolase [Dactylosporangium aurantiacum]|uniref:Alpha/beta hydrolase n=1 Tax=Dactylosporangium aurantiacum TaxID=35754 RepID=A0A9Q9ILM7_9ACTN|nr:alpha/beta hydrolase [Dactylosporangium aurantiacum]MDG6110507.1 alpha/beta hydrolase [Dactylosporangium aurantiacum]UWZ58427.1 alpha/beta hydrolase [Dactylosporangium aurantiacum]